MNKTSLRMKATYQNMTKSEKKIADWLLENPGEIIPLSITELADKCGCSEATIVRFARHLDFCGYQELKISLAREENSSNMTEGLDEGDTPGVVFEKVIDTIYCSLEQTKNVLDHKELEKMANAILSANHVAIYGLGNSAAVGLDFQHKLMRVGIHALFYHDNHLQAISASHLKEGDLAIGISHSGSSKDIVEALDIARKAGATTAAITNYGKSPIIKKSDIVLYTASDEIKHTILGLNSRIAQLAIISSLYCYIVNRKDAETKENVGKTEMALQGKKY
ncbi:MAG: MurR/RpiR family transcriptional regulator [Clostridia bacterium]|nr:MurR/RpiR family transcriptional regulator [Clostridia bacterium]